MRTEKREITRIRENGTHVTMPQNGWNRIAAIRSVVAKGQYAKIDGIMLDLFSASAIIKIYNAINPENQAKYREMPVSKMASIAFKLLK